MIAAFAVALAGVVLAQLAPGPNLAAVASAALGRGRTAGLFVTLGIATTIFAWVALNAMGLGAVLALYPSALTAMKLAGGGYLLFLAVRGARAALRGTGPRLRAGETMMSPVAAWRRGALVNITNPKAALMWSAVVTFLFGSGLSAIEVLAFAPAGALTATCVYGAYALLFSTGPARSAYGRFARAFEAVFAATFGMLGATLFFSGIRELRS